MDRYFYGIGDYNGRKEIYFSGNVFYNDGDETDSCFRYAQWVGLYFTVEKLRNLIDTGMLFETLYEKIKYLDDLTEEQAIDICRTYWAGISGEELDIVEVNEDTPCGYYWFEAKEDK